MVWSSLICLASQGMTHDFFEIAQATESHLGTVMSRLHHARKNLQEALRPYYESIGDDFHLSLIGHGVGTKRKQERPTSAEPDGSDEL